MGLMSIFGSADWSEYQVIVPLTSEPNEDGNVFIFAGKNGKGEIFEINGSELNELREQDLSPVRDISFFDTLSVNTFPQQTAAMGVQVILESGYASSVAEGLSIDLVRPHLAKANDLPELKAALIDVRNEIGIAVSNKEHLENGMSYSDGRQAQVDYLNQVHHDVEKMIAQVDLALNLQGYRESLISELDAGSDLSDQARSIIENMLARDTSSDLTVGNAGHKQDI